MDIIDDKYLPQNFGFNFFQVSHTFHKYKQLKSFKKRKMLELNIHTINQNLRMPLCNSNTTGSPDFIHS